MKRLAGLLLGAALSAETLQYRAEWRLMEAGRAQLTFEATSARLQLETQGFVRSLYRVQDDYLVTFSEKLCAASSLMKVEEGKKRREIKVTYPGTAGKAEFVERDLLKDQVVGTRQVEVPACVHDVMAGLARLREMKPDVGQVVELPVSDGKKSAQVRVEAQKKETIRTPAGVFSTIRHEAFVMNNIIYRRKGRLFVWLTDDGRRLPVQVRIQLPFWLGTVTLQLKQEDRG